jgi:hypothetical protein
VIKGNVDINFVTDEMLNNTVFPESTDTNHANGLWKTLDVPEPTYPIGSAHLYQCFGEDCPQWAMDVCNKFDWVQYKQVTINKLTTGTFIPPHVDSMYRLKQDLKNNQDTLENLELVRINIFLQDHQLGHWLNIDDESFDNYNKGDYTFIFPGVIHTVANLGYKPRYTMQITGLIDYRLKI